MKPKLMFYIMLSILLVSIAGGGAGFYFSLARLEANIENIATAKAEKQLAEQEIIQSQSLASTYENLKNDLPDIDEVLPESKAQDDALIRLYAIADAVGVDIEPIGIEDSKEPGETSQLEIVEGKPGVLAQKYNISFTTERYSQLIDFIGAVENSERYMMFSDMKISSNGTSQNSINAGLLVFSKGTIAPPKPIPGSDAAKTEATK